MLTFAESGSSVLHEIPYFKKNGQGRSRWSYSVMVITLDFESSNPGSNPGRTFLFNFFFFFLMLKKKDEHIFITRRSLKKKNVRHPGVEPGPPRWQRGIITARLMARVCVDRESNPGHLLGRQEF